MAEQGERTSHSPAPGVLRGRRAESAASAEFVIAKRRGEGRTLVLRGADSGWARGLEARFRALLSGGVEARTALRVAHDMFTEIGMMPFS